MRVNTSRPNSSVPNQWAPLGSWRLAVGTTQVSFGITRESREYIYAALYLGEHHVTAAVKPDVRAHVARMLLVEGKPFAEYLGAQRVQPLAGVPMSQHDVGTISITLDGDLATAKPKTLRFQMLHVPASLTRSHPNATWVLDTAAASKLR